MACCWTGAAAAGAGGAGAGAGDGAGAAGAGARGTPMEGITLPGVCGPLAMFGLT